MSWPGCRRSRHGPDAGRTNRPAPSPVPASQDVGELDFSPVTITRPPLPYRVSPAPLPLEAAAGGCEGVARLPCGGRSHHHSAAPHRIRLAPHHCCAIDAANLGALRSNREARNHAQRCCAPSPGTRSACHRPGAHCRSARHFDLRREDRWPPSRARGSRPVAARAPAGMPCTCAQSFAAAGIVRQSRGVPGGAYC